MSYDVAAYAEYLKTYRGLREGHPVGMAEGCIPVDHCHIHHVDEPSPAEGVAGKPAQVCGECFHVYATEMDLQAEVVRFRTREWQAGLRVQAEEPLDHSGAPVARPVEEITSFPLCTHSF